MGPVVQIIKFKFIVQVHRLDQNFMAMLEFFIQFVLFSLSSNRHYMGVPFIPGIFYFMFHLLFLSLFPFIWQHFGLQHTIVNKLQSTNYGPRTLPGFGAFSNTHIVTRRRPVGGELAHFSSELKSQCGATSWGLNRPFLLLNVELRSWSKETYCQTHCNKFIDIGNLQLQNQVGNFFSSKEWRRHEGIV